MRALIVIAVLSVLFLTARATAERANLSPERLQEEATHVVTGTIKAVYSRDVETERQGRGTVETHSVLEIEVDAVEKGGGIAPKDVIYARCWRVKTSGEGPPRPGASGHRIPAEASRVRAYLARGTYLPTGQEDNGLTVVYPNGIETLDVGATGTRRR